MGASPPVSTAGLHSPPAGNSLPGSTHPSQTGSKASLAGLPQGQGGEQQPTQQKQLMASDVEGSRSLPGLVFECAFYFFLRKTIQKTTSHIVFVGFFLSAEDSSPLQQQLQSCQHQLSVAQERIDQLERDNAALRQQLANQESALQRQTQRKLAQPLMQLRAVTQQLKRDLAGMHCFRKTFFFVFYFFLFSK